MKFTSIVKKVDELCDVTDRNTILIDGHTALSEQGIWFKTKRRGG